MRFTLSTEKGETCAVMISAELIQADVYEADQEGCIPVFYYKRGNGRDFEEFLIKVEHKTGIQFFEV